MIRFRNKLAHIMSIKTHVFVKFAITIALVVTFMFETYDKLTHEYPTRHRYLAGDHDGILNRDTSASRKLRQTLITISSRLHTLVTIAHIYLAIKFILVGLLYFDSFADYRYYDCYVLGRTSFSGQNYISTIVLGLIVNFYILGYRYMVRSRVRYSFDYEVLRFLKLDTEEVLGNEIEIEEDRVIRKRSSNAMASNEGDFRHRYSILDTAIKDFPTRYGTQYGKIKFHFENPFRPYPDQPDNTLIRLNRTSRVHRSLRLFVVSLYTVGLLFGAIVLMSLVIIFTSRTIFTAHGFFVNYDACIRYIKSLTPERSKQFSFIYDQDSTEPPSQSIPSLPIFNLYHVLRLSIDLLDNAIMYCDPFIASTIHTSYMILQVVDLIVYAHLLEQRLVDTIEMMRNEHQTRFIRSVQLDSIASLAELDAYRQDNSKREPEDFCLTTLQAYILDYLHMVRRYQDYSVYQASAILFIWISLTAGISFWLATNTFNNLQYEFRFAQMGLGLFAVISMGISAVLESKSRKLYHFMSVAMSIDRDVLVSKQKWCHLSKFFYPRPMYCFALFGQSEMSWLFCMKVS